MFREQGRTVGFDIQGHAGFADAGSDIVCSAVSALAQTTALGLTELLHLNVGLSIDEDNGKMHCILGRNCTDEECEKADILLSTLYLGLNSIQENYGKYLKITQREV